MDRNEKIKAIIEWFEDNEEVFNDCIEDLDSYNGYLGDDRIYSMDELDELYNGTDPTEILRRAFYGCDAETWHTDSHGEKEYGPFCPNRDYFTSDGCGNFVSMDYKDYSDHLDEWAVEAMAENRGNLYYINDNPELRDLFDELERDEEDEAEDEAAHYAEMLNETDEEEDEQEEADDE